jgi:hypothetical protein
MPGPLRSTVTLDGYPQAWGDRMISMVDHKGPLSYTQIAPGAPPTGGDQITAAEFGLKFITMLWGGSLSDDGTFEVEGSPGVAQQGEPTKWFLMWITAATGAQVAGATNLSPRTIRLVAIGR